VRPWHWLSREAVDASRYSRSGWMGPRAAWSDGRKPAHSSGVATVWALRSPSTEAILWYDSMIKLPELHHPCHFRRNAGNWSEKSCVLLNSICSFVWVDKNDFSRLVILHGCRIGCWEPIIARYNCFCAPTVFIHMPTFTKVGFMSSKAILF